MDRVDPADQADGVRPPEPYACVEREPLASRRTGSQLVVGLNPHGFLKRPKSLPPVKRAVDYSELATMGVTCVSVRRPRVPVSRREAETWIGRSRLRALPLVERVVVDFQVVTVGVTCTSLRKSRVPVSRRGAETAERRTRAFDAAGSEGRDGYAALRAGVAARAAMASKAAAL
jgi:hypothetical protein